MSSWLSHLDINAIIIAIEAAVLYIHNHSFRTGNTPSLKGPAAVTIVLCALLAANGCKNQAQEQATIHTAGVAVSCGAEALADYEKAVQAAGPGANKGTIAIEIGLETAVCLWNQLHGQQPTEIPATLKAGSGS